jgi:hypothetical protein
MNWVGRVARNKDFWESQKERGPVGRARRRWEDGIRMDLREIGWERVVWIQLAQDRGW